MNTYAGISQCKFNVYSMSAIPLPTLDDQQNLQQPLALPPPTPIKNEKSATASASTHAAKEIPGKMQAQLKPQRLLPALLSMPTPFWSTFALLSMPTPNSTNLMLLDHLKINWCFWCTVLSISTSADPFDALINLCNISTSVHCIVHI